MDEATHLPDPVIDELLGQRPFAAAPPGFTDRVMAQIQAVPVLATPTPIRYKLEPLDIALPVLVAFLVILVLGLTGELTFLGLAAPIDWSAVRPMIALPLPTPWLSRHWLVLMGLLVLAEIGLGVLFCMWLWLDQPLVLANEEA